MAQTLTLEEMLEIGRKFEPKRKFRFIFEVDGIDTFLIKDAERLTLRPRRFLKPKTLPIRVTIYDTIDPNAAAKVFGWIYNDQRVRQASIKLLDPLGLVVERWDLQDVELMLADFGKLDYASNDSCTISLLIKYRDFECTFGDAND